MGHSSLYFRRTGRGSPVVFLHGVPTAWDALSGLARAISATREAIEIALPGYGASPPLPAPYDLQAAQVALEAALLGAGIRECALVGFSGGAYRAFALALRRAIRVTHLFSLSGMAGLSEEDAAGFRGLATAVRAGADLSGLPTTRFLSPEFARSHPEACAAVEGWAGAASRETIAGELEAFAAAEDLTPRLGELDLPVVARVGALDVATPVAKSEAMVAACRSARLEVVPDAGHALMYEDLAGCVASLEGLLR